MSNVSDILTSLIPNEASGSTFTAFVRQPYPEQLTFYTTEQFRVKPLLKGPTVVGW